MRDVLLFPVLEGLSWLVGLLGELLRVVQKIVLLRLPHYTWGEEVEGGSFFEKFKKLYLLGLCLDPVTFVLAPCFVRGLWGNMKFFSFGTGVAVLKEQDNNSYLLSPEKGWFCPPRTGLFLFCVSVC